jgi:hypothetical protein
MEDNLVGLTKAALRITPLSRKPLVSIACMTRTANRHRWVEYYFKAKE